MKSTLVRSFVLVLVAAGFTASSVSSAAASKKASKPAMTLGMVGSPTPLCPLNDPKGCGIDPDVQKGK